MPIRYFGDHLEPWLALHKAIDELLTRQALLGTTEVEVSTTEPVKASQAEIDELIAIHGKYIDPPIKDTEILDVYAGLRPIVLPRFATNRDTKAMSRESMTAQTR